MVLFSSSVPNAIPKAPTPIKAVGAEYCYTPTDVNVCITGSFCDVRVMASTVTNLEEEKTVSGQAYFEALYL